MKKLGYSMIAAMLACGIAAAQDVQTKTQSKVNVEDGKSVTVTGCVARSADGYTLTNVADKKGTRTDYVLAATDSDDLDDLKDHVGHRVQIEGKAADEGKGKVTVETKTETKVADGDTSETKAKSQVKGDLKGLPFLGVKSVKMIAAVCP